MEEHDFLRDVDPAFRNQVKLEVERDALELKARGAEDSLLRLARRLAVRFIICLTAFTALFWPFTPDRRNTLPGLVWVLLAGVSASVWQLAQLWRKKARAKQELHQWSSIMEDYKQATRRSVPPLPRD